MILTLIYSFIMVSEISSASECNGFQNNLKTIFRTHESHNASPKQKSTIPSTEPRYGSNDEAWMPIPLESKYTQDGYLIDAAKPDNEVIETAWAYHGTSTKFFDSIKKNGIDHSKGLTVNGGKMQTNKGAASTRSLSIADYFSKKTTSRVGDEKVIYRWKTTNPGNVNESDLAPPVPAQYMEYSIDSGDTWFKLDQTPLQKARDIQEQLDASVYDYKVSMTSPVFSNGRLRVEGSELTFQEFVQTVKNTYSENELNKLNRTVVAFPSDSRSLMDLKSSLFNPEKGHLVYPIHAKKSLNPSSKSEGFPVIFGLHPVRPFSIGSSKSGVANSMWLNTGLKKEELKAIFVPKEKIPEVKKRIHEVFGDDAKRIQVEDISLFEK